jgi:predicted ester cyclase
LHAFSDKKAIEEINIAADEIVASSGYQEATHTGEWLGIPASDKQVKIRYMDFWHVDVDEESGERKLAENLVLIDILGVLEQCGYDVNKVLKFVGSKPPRVF